MSERTNTWRVWSGLEHPGTEFSVNRSAVGRIPLIGHEWESPGLGLFEKTIRVRSSFGPQAIALREIPLPFGSKAEIQSEWTNRSTLPPPPCNAG